MHLPAFNFLGIGTEAADVVISNLEHGAERATVFTGISGHANVIFAAVIGVGVAAESSGGNVASLWAAESASDFCLIKTQRLRIVGTF